MPLQVLGGEMTLEKIAEDEKVRENARQARENLLHRGILSVLDLDN